MWTLLSVFLIWENYFQHDWSTTKSGIKIWIWRLWVACSIDAINFTYNIGQQIQQEWSQLSVRVYWVYIRQRLFCKVCWGAITSFSSSHRILYISSSQILYFYTVQKLHQYGRNNAIQYQFKGNIATVQNRTKCIWPIILLEHTSKTF